MFRELGPNARALLEVVAFFPQGINEKNLDWLFPEISNRTTIFDRFCVLSLTYRNNGFITMLAPLRDYIRPQDPMSSRLLCATKDHYFTRMSIKFDRNKPTFRKSRWIVAEDVNVEHLLDVFTSIDKNPGEVWNACTNFIRHLIWHKPRHTVLRQKIKGLPDDHPSKPECLLRLGPLVALVGNRVERKRLFDHALKLERERGNDRTVVRVLGELSDANRTLGFYKEAIQQAREAFGIYQRKGSKVDQARCLGYLARSLDKDKQLDAATEAASNAIDLLPEKGQEFLVCKSHQFLCDMYRSKGEKNKAVHHLEAALAIASIFNWQDQLFWISYSMSTLFLDQREFDSAHAHIKQAKSHVLKNKYHLGRAMEQQAITWHRQSRLKEARSEALHASEVYGKLGATRS
jgi:tetratricopeptide (TPR) repeat protein